jgi:hypothetical protein
MFRHLKNITELVMYASVSCGLAFFARLFPAFYFPIVLLRLAVFAYCFYVIGTAENNRSLAFVLGGAMFIGLIGGNWDYLEVWFRFNQENLSKLITVGIFIITTLLGFYLYFNGVFNEQSSKK